MGTAARLHANQAGLQLGKERQKLCPPQGLVEHHVFIGGDPVDLKNVLGQPLIDCCAINWIQADCCNLHGVAPFLAVIDTYNMTHRHAAKAGAIKPIRNGRPFPI
jgi:hypothetical protein